MKFGHHGANHPVQDLNSKRVMITSQNHGFAVSEKDLPDLIEISHRSLFDQTIQGIRIKNKPSIQFSRPSRGITWATRRELLIR